LQVDKPLILLSYNKCDRKCVQLRLSVPVGPWWDTQMRSLSRVKHPPPADGRSSVHSVGGGRVTRDKERLYVTPGRPIKTSRDSLPLHMV